MRRSRGLHRIHFGPAYRWAHRCDLIS